MIYPHLFILIRMRACARARARVQNLVTLSMNKSEVFYEARFIRRCLTEWHFGTAHFAITFLTLIT